MLKNRKNIETLINFILILGFPLFLILYGMDFTDSPFSMRSAQSPDNAVLTWLTALIGHAWASIFSDSLLSFRLLNYFVTESIVLIFYFVYFYRKDFLQFSRYALTAIILTVATSSNIFGYGSSSLLCLIILFVCLHKFSSNPNFIYVVVCGFVSIMAMLVKFPNIVIIPVFFILLGVFTFVKYGKSALSTKNTWFFLIKIYMIYGLSCLFALSVFFVLFMSPFDYYSNVTDKLSALSHSDATHSTSKIYTNYMRDAIAIAKYMGVIVMMLIAYNLSANYLKIKRWLISLALFLVYFYYIYINNTGDYNFGYSLQITAFTLFFLFVFLYHSYEERNFTHLFIIFTISVLLFMPAIGSDTGLLKCKSFATFILIFLLNWIFEKKMKATGVKYFITVLLFSLITYGLYNRFTWFYGDTRNIIELKYTIHHPKLKYIKTTIYRKELTEKIIKKVDALTINQKDKVFFGAAGQMFYYLYNQAPLSNQLFYLEMNDKKVIQQLEYLIQNEHKHPLVVILFGHPNSGNWPQCLNDTNNKDAAEAIVKSKDLIKMLTANSYQEVVSDKAFLIYKENESINGRKKL